MASTNYRTLLGAQYLSGEDFMGKKSVKMNLVGWATEDVPVPPAFKETKSKTVLKFKETPRRMVLNHANGQKIARAVGSAEVDDWVKAGVQIEFYFDENVTAFGKKTGGIRVRSVSVAGKGDAE